MRQGCCGCRRRYTIGDCPRWCSFSLDTTKANRDIEWVVDRGRG